MPRKPKQQKAPGVYEKVKGSGIWWIRYTDENGKRRKESVGKFNDAKERYETRKAEVRTGAIIMPKRAHGVKLTTLIDAALEFSEKNHADTRNFKQRLEVIRGEFGDRIASSIPSKEWSEWLDDKADEFEWENATFNRYKAAISKAYKLALQHSQVQTNPISNVSQRKESLGRVRFLIEDEEKRLRESITERRPHCIFQLDLALHTGMRLTEQFTTEIDQVDLSQKFIYLSQTKNGSSRYVHLNQSAVECIEKLKAERSRLGLKFPTLFFDKQHTPIKNPREWFRVSCEEAEIEGVTWHILRHTFASRLVMEGTDLKTVQELMGHKTISMTARYAHLAPAHLQAALGTLTERAKRLGVA